MSPPAARRATLGPRRRGGAVVGGRFAAARSGDGDSPTPGAPPVPAAPDRQLTGERSGATCPARLRWCGWPATALFGRYSGAVSAPHWPACRVEPPAGPTWGRGAHGTGRGLSAHEPLPGLLGQPQRGHPAAGRNARRSRHRAWGRSRCGSRSVRQALVHRPRPLSTRGWDGRRLTELPVSASPVRSSRTSFSEAAAARSSGSSIFTAGSAWRTRWGAGCGSTRPRPARQPGTVAAHRELRPRGLVHDPDRGRPASEEGDSEELVELPAAPGALAGGPDGNLWVVARRGPRLFRVSPSGSVTGFTLDLPQDARLRDLTRDTPHGVLWIACARPRALLRVALPELRSKLRQAIP